MENTRYINPMIDFSLRKLFGSDPNKEILIDFLNEVFRGRKKIIDLVYNKNEHDGEVKEEARAVFDLLCTGDKGEKFLIEVQYSVPMQFIQSTHYYASKLLNEGKSYFSGTFNGFKEVYIVAIMDKPIKPSKNDDQYIHEVSMADKNTGEQFFKGIEGIYLDLSNFYKEIGECGTRLDMWLYCLKHAHEMTSFPSVFDDSTLKKVFSLLEYINLTPEEKYKYDFEVGFKEGQQQVAIRAAYKLKGMAMADIADITGLSIKQIERL